MAKERINPEQKKQLKQLRRRKIVSLAAGLLCVYFTVSIITVQVRIYSEKQKKQEIEEQIESQQLENDNIAMILSGGEEKYMERIAREKLDYAGVDERIYIDISGS